ncbi:MAG: UbiA prenyltransferase family protein [Bacteroidota bacterium]
MWKAYLQLMRPHQYLKNLVIFLPAFFAQRILELALLTDLFLGWAGFSLLASSIYIFNDYRDREDDRAHPIKKARPLAAGTVQVSWALGLMGGLMFLGIGLIAWVHPKGLFIAGIYIAVNLGYSLGLKHVPILDLTQIAIGFLLRISLGAVLAVPFIPLSGWIVMMIFLGALFLGLAKRRDDLILAQQGHKVRKSIDGYNLTFVNGAMILMGSVLIVAYISYTLSPQTQAKFETPYLYTTAFLVVLGILRYLQLVFVEEKGGEPTRLFLSDISLKILITAWGGLCLWLIYFT